MKTMRMRLASWFMIVCILTGVFASSMSVQAASDTTWEELVDMCQFGLTTTKYLLTSTFGFFTQDLDTYMKNNDRYWQYAKDFQARWDGKEEGQTEIEVTKDELQGLYDITKESLTSLNGYYLMQSSMSKTDITNIFSAYKDRITSNDSLLISNFLSTHDNFMVYSDENRVEVYSLKTLDGYYYVDAANNNSIVYYKNGNIDTRCTDLLYLYASSGSTSKASVTIYNNNGCRYPNNQINFIGYSGSLFKLFYSSTDMLNYINGGQPGSYQCSNFNMPVLSGNTLNVDLGKAAETDWSKVNKSIYDAVSDAITDAGGWGALDETQKQEIIDSKMDDILGSLGEIGDNTGESNALLSSIKDILKSINNHVVSISDYIIDSIANQGKLFTLFQDFSFEKLLETIKDSGGGGGSIADSAVGTIIGSFISDLLEKVMNGDETAEDAVSILVTRFSKLVDVSKTKFPFSLPWDVVVIFETLSHEPETPVIDFPIKVASVGFDYTIHIDMKDFESLSKMCRAFFAITFALILIKLTLLMINRGDLDA